MKVLVSQKSYGGSEVLGIETRHAGKVFNGTEDDIVEFLQSMEYKKTKKVEHDTFFLKNNYFLN